MFDSRRTLAALVALAFICTALAAPGPARASVTSLELVAGEYTGNSTYVPGEVMSIIVTGDTTDERLSVFSVMGEERLVSNVIIPSSGSVKVSYTIPDVPDGSYSICVKLQNGAIEAERPFRVQGYVFAIETDRDAYLSSDSIKVFWTANNLKDQTLPSSGVGKISIWAAMPGQPLTAVRILEAHMFTASAGSFTFKLPPLVNYSMEYYVDGWFNSSSTSPLRFQYDRADFHIKRLGVLIDLDKDQYTAGSLLTLTVLTVATDNTANPSYDDTGEPDCNVTISIRKVGNIDPTYKPITLMTDSQGQLRHIVALSNESYTEGAVFDLEVYAYKGTNSISDYQSFDIVSSSSISIVLSFNREQYASGERMFVNASASAIGDFTSTTFTYILEIRALSGTGSLFARDTRMTGNFSFASPWNFEGFLWLMMTVDDGAGNSASVVKQVNVAYALIIVNAESDVFDPNDTMAITYSVIGNLAEQMSMFYAVYDKEGKVVEEGVTSNGLFSFSVPAAPSSYYDFTVFASAGGRVVHGSDRAHLFSSYLVTLDFNRDYYRPGDILAVNYRIVILGNAVLPPTFNISYGLANGQMANLQTAQTGGTLLYPIPEDIDQGEQLFVVTCDLGGSGASAMELLLVQSDANPLWHLDIGGIPVFSVGVLVIALLALYAALSTRRRVGRLESEGPVKVAPESRKAQESATNTIVCVECGSQIEITTTRRPIEVMCPHCGEIQHIE
jgi:hypothetical protein